MSSSGAVRHIASRAELSVLLAKAPPALTVVDFYAVWCGPCKAIAPEIEKLALQNPHVQFAKVDVDKAPDLAQHYDIQAMPTFLCFKGETKVGEVVGADMRKINAIISEHGRPQVASMPPDVELEKMSVKELLNVFQQRNISRGGLLEKGELVAFLKKHR